MVHIIKAQYEPSIAGVVTGCEEADVKQAVTDIDKAIEEADYDHMEAAKSLQIDADDVCDRAELAYKLLIKRGATDVHIKIHSI